MTTNKYLLSQEQAAQGAGDTGSEQSQKVSSSHNPLDLEWKGTENRP